MALWIGERIYFYLIDATTGPRGNSFSATLKIKQTETTAESVRVSWAMEADAPTRVNVVPFELRLHDGRDKLLDSISRVFARHQSDSTLEKCAVFALLSVVLPLLLLDDASVSVEAPWKWTEADNAYWKGVLGRLGFDPGRCEFHGTGPEVHLQYAQPCRAPLSMALFYGGGIESNAALSALLPYKPALFIVDGPAWMNNNTSGDVSLKRKLEFDVAAKNGLELIYARVNIRKITSRVWDATLNHFCTGGMFYWCAAAAGLARGISLFIVSQELEYTLIRDRFDKSLTPDHLFRTHHAEAPLLIPVMGWASSFELFGSLRESPLMDSLYSCFHNSETRWCGKCGKCYRVYEWARRNAVDPARFGMLEPPQRITEGSQLHRLHWQDADELHPEPGRRSSEGVGLAQIGLTDISLVDQVHLQLFRVTGGSVEFDGNKMAMVPRTSDGGMEVSFDRLTMRGLDEFVGRSVSSTGKWQVSFELCDRNHSRIAEWSQVIESGKEVDFRFSFPEQFGTCELILRLRTLEPSERRTEGNARIEFHLPVLRRKSGTTTPSSDS